MRNLITQCLLHVLVALVMVLGTLSQTPTADVQRVTPEEDEQQKQVHVRQAWIQLDKDLKATISKVMRKALPVLMKEVYKKEVTGSCLSSLLQVASGLRASKLWAFQMLDSSGRIPEGFLSGTLTSLGNYKECVDIDVNERKVKMQGQYCSLSIKPPINDWRPFTSVHLTVPEFFNISTPGTVVSFLAGFLHNFHITTIKVGICSPSPCTEDDINRLIQIIPEQLNLNWGFEVSRCETKKPVQFTSAQIAVLYVMGVAMFLVMFGTIVDKIWALEDMEGRSVKATLFHLARSFSFTANARKLAQFSAPEENLGFTYGLVTIVFLWVCISNTFMYVNYEVASNFVEALRILQHLFYEIALNRVLPLQVLLYISGFLTTYKWMKSPEKNMNVVKFLFKKYWRYTPAYALVLAVIILTPTWGSGPSWHNHMNDVYENCKANWWYNVLYINNFIDSSKTCLDHTWIYAVAAQLHVIALFVLIPLKLRPKIGLMINFVLSVASLASVALTNVYYDLPPNEMAAFLHPKDRNFYAEHSYYRVYSHVFLYSTGVFTGYLMAKHPQLKISRKASWSLWLLTTAALMAALCTVHEWRSGAVPSPLLAAVYTTFSKVAEAAFLAWLTVACMTGHSGGAGDVLGWRPFAFFARLTFIAYIMHVPIMKMVMGFKKSHLYIAELEIFYIVLSHFSGSYIVSYLLYMCLEAPWMALSDVVYRRCRAQTFTRDEDRKSPMTEKPIKFYEKEGKFISSSKNWMNTLEKC